jgi:uncharacterized membrane protein YdjX (TVP38/TMEM64 family)
MGDRLRRYDDVIARNGFAASLYLRLMGIPFAPLNFGMGLTNVGFRPYVAGTGIGLIGGLFVLAYFGGAVRAIWASGNWGNIICREFFISLGLLAALAATPIVIQKLISKRPENSITTERTEITEKTN